jgi:hypothetical protein
MEKYMTLWRDRCFSNITVFYNVWLKVFDVEQSESHDGFSTFMDLRISSGKASFYRKLLSTIVRTKHSVIRGIWERACLKSWSTPTILSVAFTIVKKLLAKNWLARSFFVSTNQILTSIFSDPISILHRLVFGQLRKNHSLISLAKAKSCWLLIRQEKSLSEICWVERLFVGANPIVVK